MDEKGNIYARGSQDMKSTSIQHIEAIRRLKLNGTRLKRTINISFMPDEEIGGLAGMKKFVQTQDFKDLKVGLALDEGNSSSGNKILLSYGEKTWFQIWIHCPGTSGHGSVLLNDTAGEKLRKVIDRFMDFRASEKAKLNHPQVKAGDVFSVNLTIIKVRKHLFYNKSKNSKNILQLIIFKIVNQLKFREEFRSTLFPTNFL